MSTELPDWVTGRCSPFPAQPPVVGIDLGHPDGDRAAMVAICCARVVDEFAAYVAHMRLFKAAVAGLARAICRQLVKGAVRSILRLDQRRTAPCGHSMRARRKARYAQRGRRGLQEALS